MMEVRGCHLFLYPNWALNWSLLKLIHPPIPSSSLHELVSCFEMAGQKAGGEKHPSSQGGG